MKTIEKIKTILSPYQIHNTYITPTDFRYAEICIIISEDPKRNRRIECLRFLIKNSDFINKVFINISLIYDDLLEALSPPSLIVELDGMKLEGKTSEYCVKNVNLEAFNDLDLKMKRLETLGVKTITKISEGKRLKIYQIILDAENDKDKYGSSFSASFLYAHYGDYLFGEVMDEFCAFMIDKIDYETFIERILDRKDVARRIIRDRIMKSVKKC